MNAAAELSPTASAIAERVSAVEYARLLLVPRARLQDGLLLERAEAARAWYVAHGRPQVVVRTHEIVVVLAGAIELRGGGALPGAALAGRLGAARASRLHALLVSAGPEVDAASAQAWAEGRPDDGFFLERFGVAVAEELLRATAVRLCRDAETLGETLLPHLSPGCGGWELDAQAPLWRLLAGESEALGAVTLHASGSLSPKASLLAALGVAPGAGTARTVGFRRRGEPVAGPLGAPSRTELLRPQTPAGPSDACRGCDLNSCGFRRAPYGGAA